MKCRPGASKRGMRFALTRLVFSPRRKFDTFNSCTSDWFCSCFSQPVARSQQPVTRQQAVDIAVMRGARAAVARADTLVGAAQLITARRVGQSVACRRPTPKALPNYHAIVDFPLDITGIRGARIRAAEATRLASQYRFEFERAAAALDADTTYTRALAALERVKLSRRNARDADSLRRMAVIRRNAGDASELDVLLATVNAGQAANLAAADSVSLISSVFDLQTVMGLDTNRIAVMPSDSLTLPPPSPPPDAIPAFTLPVAAAQQALSAADISVRVQRRSVFTPFSVQGGVEWGDPGTPGILPTFGLSIPLPLLNRNRGPIAQAEAERERARAELALTLFQTQATIGRAVRQRNVALEKLQRDRLPRGKRKSNSCDVTRRLQRRSAGAGDGSGSPAECARHSLSIRQRSRGRLDSHGHASPLRSNRTLAMRYPGLFLIVLLVRGLSPDVGRACRPNRGRSGQDGHCDRSTFRGEKVGSIGTVSARSGHFASLSAPAPARIASVLVSPGQHVSVGAGSRGFRANALHYGCSERGSGAPCRGARV